MDTTITSTQGKDIVDRWAKMCTIKMPYQRMWQLIGEYVYIRKLDYNIILAPGQFNTEAVFDTTAVDAHKRTSASLMGHIFPASSDNFDLVAPDDIDPMIAALPDVKQFYSNITRITHKHMRHKDAGLARVSGEYFHDLVGPGTAGIGTFKSDVVTTALSYSMFDVRECCIDENARGQIDTTFQTKKWTVRQIIQEYGYDSVSQEIKDKWNAKNYDEKVEVIIAIEPRIMRSKTGSHGVHEFPYKSVHVEKSSLAELRNSGFHENPIAWGRLWKNSGEPYGRSPSTDLMPTVIIANALEELSLLGTEKAVDPPLVMQDDGSFGGGVVDTSARALIVRKVSGKIQPGEKGIEPLHLVDLGDLKTVEDKLARIRDTIKIGFMLDLLQSLGKESRITAYEADLLNTLRGMMLCLIFANQYDEVWTPTIDRSVSILLEGKYYGLPEQATEYHENRRELGLIPLVIPEPIWNLMMAGEEWYKINYKTPAARILRSEELAALERFKGMAIEGGQAIPEIMDNLDVDVMIRTMQQLTGAGADVVRDTKTVASIRKARAEAQQMNQGLVQGEAKAEIAKKATQAAHSAAKAGLDPVQVLGSI